MQEVISSGESRNFQRGFQVQEVFNNCDPRLRSVAIYSPAGVNVNVATYA